MSKLISIDEVTPGMVIVQITKQNGPVKIRKSGLVSSDAMVQGLAEMGVQEVEVDLDQTVEIAPTPQYRTQTQALLRGQHDTRANFDKSLSDQFNRSLFLPTVQGLPSMWKVYGREVASYAIVIIGGLCVGYTAATRSDWWPAIVNSYSLATQPVVTAQPPIELATELQAVTPADSGVDEANEAQLDPAQTANSAAAQESASSETVAVLPVDNATEKVTAPNLPEPDISADLEQALKEEGRVLNAQQETVASVSPEIMERFNQAIAALDNQDEHDSSEPQTRVTVRDDIMRVDQLPVRLLTRLPSMNFSAHMYASAPRDRWVRVNGRQLGEGDWIDDRVQIVNIEAQRVVMSFERELFTMAALTDW